MFDMRPVGYVIGLLVAALGVSMLVPLAVDYYQGNDYVAEFATSAFLTGLAGSLLVLTCANGTRQGLTLQQMLLLTVAVWAVLPIFGAIPFVVGATEASVTDAYFEAMSGLTTTGSTVFSGLDDLPHGLLLWRSLLQWFGGVGIIVVAMVFLPTLKVGGMQIFRSEAFETMGKILPRAAEIARQISVIYVLLTAACFLSYLAVGLDVFDALNHALTTLSTGGFSTHDASFGAFQGAPEYVASVFMVLASLPFVRYVQIMAGTAQPFFEDSQIRAFLAVVAALVLVLAFYRVTVNGDHAEHALREGVFNVTSIITGTGYASVDYQLWGGFPVAVFFFLGLIGGCAGSTCCSVKIFRYQILFSAIAVQVRKVHSPNGIFYPRYQGAKVGDDVLSSVMAFFAMFFVTLAILTVLLDLTGLDTITALSGAATAITNVGPGLGPEIGPAGNFSGLNDAAKWILSAGMLIGRLEVMAVLALFTASFWRA